MSWLAGKAPEPMPYLQQRNQTLICTHTGGRLVYQYVKKTAKHPHCAVSGAVLNGVSGKGARMQHGVLEAALMGMVLPACIAECSLHLHSAFQKGRPSMLRRRMVS
eukprot:1140215-Pelagomonas_calceolata.AAC.2